MGWLDKFKPPRFSDDAPNKTGFAKGLWDKCPSCSEIIFNEDLSRAHNVCGNCGYHFRINTRDRIDIMTDQGSFKEIDADLKAADPLSFKDLKKYKDRIKAAQEKFGAGAEAFIYGDATILELEVVLGSFVFEYMGGSMGSVVGEKLTRCLERSLAQRKPCIVITASGGARMQEGILSLMQMAKTSVVVRQLRDAGIPLIILLTDPTTGGVAASIAMLGDVLLAEPNALIGFAGPRVIEQTIKQTLPEGFQRSEYLLEHGMLDRIVPRPKLKSTLYQILKPLSEHLSRSKNGGGKSLDGEA